MDAERQQEERLCSEPGVYALVLEVRPGGFTTRVGALGEIRFEGGYYCYVGSALKGLDSRLRRHFRRCGKHFHWHVDYLRAGAIPVGAVQWPGAGQAECELSERVARIAEGSVPGFGASDCDCCSHLYCFSRSPLERLAGVRISAVEGDIVRPPGRASPPCVI